MKVTLDVSPEMVALLDDLHAHGVMGDVVALVRKTKEDFTCPACERDPKEAIMTSGGDELCLTCWATQVIEGGT